MPDSFTEYLNLTKPEIGGSRDAWGPKLNDAFDKIDTWAKASNAKAEKALNAKDDLAQGVAGVITFAKKTTHTLGASFGAAIDAPGNSKFGTVEASGGAITVYGAEGNDEKGSVSLNKAGTRGIVWNLDRYSLPGADLFVNGQKVFTAGNLDPTKFFDKTATGLQSINSIISSKDAVEFRRDGGLRARWVATEAGKAELTDGETGDTFLSVGKDGSVSTKQFGDLNNRIEDRARAYAEDRANNMGNQRVVATALQGSWGLNAPLGQVATAPHPGVVTAIQPITNGGINIYGRFMYFNTPNLGWVGAYSL